MSSRSQYQYRLRSGQTAASRYNGEDTVPQGDRAKRGSLRCGLTPNVLNGLHPRYSISGCMKQEMNFANRNMCPDSERVLS